MLPIPVPVSADPAVNRLLSLDFRIGLLRRRRRNSMLRQILVVAGPLLFGVLIIGLLAVGGVVASAR